jgi:HK97 family phage prohead protease
MSALEATDTPENGRAPKNDLIRALPRAIEVRAAGLPDGEVLTGHFAVTDVWTEINSMWEGRFMERFAPGAFKKTIRDSRDRMRVLFQHGMDPQVGDKPIAAITDLREDDQGAFYEADMLDGVPDLIVSGLRAGQYGASFRFSVMREEWVEEPGPSESNPEGLPERTVKESRVQEFGPVTFPAYEQATAGLRSLTDSFLILRSTDDEGRRLLLARTKTVPMLGTRTVVRAAEPAHTDDVTDAPGVNDDAPSATDAAPSRTSEQERREPNRPRTGSGQLTPEDWSWGRHKDETPWSH